MAPGQQFISHFVAYLPDDEASVARALRLQSPDALQALGKRTCLWAFGTNVRVRLSGRGLNVQPPEQTFIWRSSPQSLDFLVTAQKGIEEGNHVLQFTVLVEDFCVASLCLNLEIASAGTSTGSAVAAGTSARRGFASYSSQDRALVVHMVGAIERSAGLKVFLDCLDLKASEEWKPRLVHEINMSDVFMLFWSRQASASSWVKWEWTTALADKGKSAMQIHPLEIDVEPPPELAELHFSDLHAMVANYASRRPVG